MVVGGSLVAVEFVYSSAPDGICVAFLGLRIVDDGGSGFELELSVNSRLLKGGFLSWSMSLFSNLRNWRKFVLMQLTKINCSCLLAMKIAFQNSYMKEAPQPKRLGVHSTLTKPNLFTEKRSKVLIHGVTLSELQLLVTPLSAMSQESQFMTSGQWGCSFINFVHDSPVLDLPLSKVQYHFIPSPSYVCYCLALFVLEFIINQQHSTSTNCKVLVHRLLKGWICESVQWFISFILPIAQLLRGLCCSLSFSSVRAIKASCCFIFPQVCLWLVYVG